MTHKMTVDEYSRIHMAARDLHERALINSRADVPSSYADGIILDSFEKIAVMLGYDVKRKEVAE